MDKTIKKYAPHTYGRIETRQPQVIFYRFEGVLWEATAIGNQEAAFVLVALTICRDKALAQGKEFEFLGVEGIFHQPYAAA